jgi:hypothetical protein
MKDPVSIKLVKRNLEERMGKELTEEFCKRTSITGFIPSFCSKHQKEDQALLWNYQKIYCRQRRISFPSIFEQKDLIRKVK